MENKKDFDEERQHQPFKQRQQFKQFVKDGDDRQVYRRREEPSMMRAKAKTPNAKCGCGGKMKEKGSYGTSGITRSKCARCGKTSFARVYRGQVGLARCW